MSRTPTETHSLIALFDLIGELARSRYQLAEKHFSALGLNHTEGRLLNVLMEQGGSAAQDVLSGRLVVDRTNAGRALQRLEQDGYIVRVKSGEDKRANHVRITAKGKKVVVEIQEMRPMMARALFGELSESDATRVVKLLKRD